MTAKLYRDALGSPLPQSVDDETGEITVHATGDTTGINFGKTKLLRDVLGSPIPNQIYDVDEGKWIIGQGGGGTGTSFNFNLLGELSDVSELPSTDNEVNDAYMINGEVHFWNGTQWINAGAIVGERGPRGLKGERGEAGEKGADGKSAYQLAVENGFIGSETDYLDSLEGKQGDPGTTDYNALNNKPIIPTSTNQLINDSNFITQAILDALKNVANGFAGLDASGLISLAQLPPATKELRVVNDLAEREALTTFEGLACYVKNAVPDVNMGGAFYIHDGAIWHKTSSDSEIIAVMDWSNILNKPSTFTPSAHTHLIAHISGLREELDGKVEKLAGKQLSTEDYTSAEKAKLAGLSNYTLPKATTSTLGGVKPDETTTAVDANGVISVIGGGGELTKEAITDALEYTPANDEDLMELERKTNSHLAQTGDLDDLETTDKTTLVAAINEVKQSANDIKNKWANVVGSPLVSTDTQAQLESKTQAIKDALASNLTVKGQSSVGTENLTDLVAKVPNINTGKRFFSGSLYSSASQEMFHIVGGGGFNAYFITYSGLPFKPSFIYASCFADGQQYFANFVKERNTFPNSIEGGYFNPTTSSSFGVLVRIDSGAAFISETGFKLPVQAFSKVFTFFAFE